MSKVMLINALEEEESRVAIVESGELLDFNYEIYSRSQTRGNIYKGVVTKVEPSLQAAFVDYGAERAGFLPVGEIREQAMSGKPKDPKRPKIEEVLRKKQEIMVQVVKEPVGTKGGALSTKVAIPGRYLVIMPGDRAGGISRKISDEDSRRKAKEILRSLGATDDMGIIVRTAGMDRSITEVKTDFLYLNKLWDTIESNYMKSKASGMVYQESDVILRSIRDYFTPDVSEIVTDDPATFERILAFVTAVMPNYLNRVRLYENDRPLFDAYGIEDQIARLHDQKVRLKSGGEIVITQTEALVAVDVNSGKATKEKDVELTAFNTNCEAAIEVARQLRLRDLGGLVVVDFIDMRQSGHIRDVEKKMRGALRADKARIETTRISKLGLMEISRQRLKKSLYTTSFSSCAACNGIGVVRSVETLALSLLRAIQGRVALGDIEFVRGDLPSDVLVYLLNAKRDELVRLQTGYDVKIQLNIRPERQGLGGRTYSANPADWLEFHRRLRRRQPQQQQQVATVEAAVKATHEARQAMEVQHREAAEAARARGEPLEVIDAILAGEDPDQARRRILEEEAREARRQIKQKGRSTRSGVVKLPPLAIDESQGITGFVIGDDGSLVAETGSGKKFDTPAPEPVAKKRRDKPARVPKVDPRDEADAFAGFTLGEDGKLEVAPQPEPPRSNGSRDEGGGDDEEGGARRKRRRSRGRRRGRDRDNGGGNGSGEGRESSGSRDGGGGGRSSGGRDGGRDGGGRSSGGRDGGGGGGGGGKAAEAIPAVPKAFQGIPLE